MIENIGIFVWLFIFAWIAFGVFMAIANGIKEKVVSSSKKSTPVLAPQEPEFDSNLPDIQQTPAHQVPTRPPTPVRLASARRCVNERCSYETEKATAISRISKGLGCPSCNKSFEGIPPLTPTSATHLTPTPANRLSPRPSTRGTSRGSSRSTNGIHVEIVDYKTGKHNARYKEEPLFQIQIYAAAVERFMGFTVKKVKLVYMRPDQHHIEEKIIRRSDINETVQKFNRVWRDINSNARDGKFPCKTGPLCNWCDAQRYCPAWEGATSTQRSRRWGPFGTRPNANPSLGRCLDRLPNTLSPTGAIEYLQCPRKFYESKISGRIVFQATEATTKGNLAHHAFEKILSVPASQRTPERAVSFIRPYWNVIRHTEEQEYVNNLSSSAITRMLRETEEVVRNWFRMENPKEMNPINTELKVEGTLGSTPMRGIIDRIDTSIL